MKNISSDLNSQKPIKQILRGLGGISLSITQSNFEESLQFSQLHRIKSPAITNTPGGGPSSKSERMMHSPGHQRARRRSPQQNKRVGEFHQNQRRAATPKSNNSARKNSMRNSRGQRSPRSRGRSSNMKKKESEFRVNLTHNNLNRNSTRTPQRALKKARKGDLPRTRIIKGSDRKRIQTQTPGSINDNNRAYSPRRGVASPQASRSISRRSSSPNRGAYSSREGLPKTIILRSPTSRGKRSHTATPNKNSSRPDFTSRRGSRSRLPPNMISSSYYDNQDQSFRSRYKNRGTNRVSSGQNLKINKLIKSPGFKDSQFEEVDSVIEGEHPNLFEPEKSSIIFSANKKQEGGYNLFASPRQEKRSTGVASAERNTPMGYNRHSGYMEKGTPTPQNNPVKQASSPYNGSPRADPLARQGRKGSFTLYGRVVQRSPQANHTNRNRSSTRNRQTAEQPMNAAAQQRLPSFHRRIRQNSVDAMNNYPQPSFSRRGSSNHQQGGAMSPGLDSGNYHHASRSRSRSPRAGGGPQNGWVDQPRHENGEWIEDNYRHHIGSFYERSRDVNDVWYKQSGIENFNLMTEAPSSQDNTGVARDYHGYPQRRSAEFGQPRFPEVRRGEGAGRGGGGGLQRGMGAPVRRGASPSIHGRYNYAQRNSGEFRGMGEYPARSSDRDRYHHRMY